MNWRQVLIYPLRMAALWLLLIVSLLLALLGPPEFAGPGLVKLVFWVMILWVMLRYSVVLVRSMAEGVDEPPAFEIEMANPFEALPLQPVLPVLLRAPQALGAQWLWLALIWSACAAIGSALQYAGGAVPHFLVYGISVYCWWLSASALGAVMHDRRIALGFVPRHSPERNAEVRAREHDRQRNRLLDDLYQQIRMQRYRSGAEQLSGWLTQIEPAELELEARHLLQQIGLWGDATALARLTAILTGFLLRQRLGPVALELIVVAERQGAVFAPGALPESRELAELARRTGQQRLAERLEVSRP